MSKPLIEDFIKSNADELRKTGNLTYSLEDQKLYLKNQYPEVYTEELFNELVEKEYAGLTFPKKDPKGKKPIFEMDLSEKEEFTKEYTEAIIPNVLEGMQFKAEEQYDLNNRKDLYDIQGDLRKKVNKEIDDLAAHDDPEKQRQIYEKNLTNLAGGSIPKTDQGVPIYDLLGMDKEKFTELDKQETYNLIMSEMRGQKLRGFEAIQLALSQGTKELNLYDIEKDDSLGPYPMNVKARELAKTFDNENKDLGWYQGTYPKFKQAIEEIPEEFEKMNEFTSQELPSDQRLQFEKYLGAFAKTYEDQISLLDSEEGQKVLSTSMPDEDSDTEKEIADNQATLNHLLNSMNNMITAENMQISYKVIDFASKPKYMDFPATPSFGRDQGLVESVKLRNIQNKSAVQESWSDDVKKTLRRLGVDTYLKAGDVVESAVASYAEETVDPFRGSKDIVVTQIDRKIADLEREKSEFPQQASIFETQIKRLKDQRQRVLESEGYVLTTPGAKSEFVQSLYAAFGSQDLDESMKLIRDMNLQDVSEDELTKELIYAGQNIEAFIHSSVDQKETSLDGQRLSLMEKSGVDFFKENSDVLFEDLPIYMQTLLYTSMNYLKDENNENQTDFAISDLEGNTLANLQYRTDVMKNFDEADLKEFVRYRDMVTKSSPAQLMEFLMMVGNKPVFDPESKTFTKKLTPAGYALNYVFPFVTQAAVETVATPLEYYHFGYDDTPSWSSRLAAKMVVGAPGLMGDAPYYAYLYGADKETQKLLEYGGLALEMVASPEKALVTAPIKRVAKGVSRLHRPTTISSDVTGPVAKNEARTAILNKIEKTSPYKTYADIMVTGAYAADVALFGTGIGMATEMARSIGTPTYSAFRSRNFGKETIIQDQNLVDDAIRTGERRGVPLNVNEVIELVSAKEFEELLADGYDPRFPEEYGKKHFEEGSDNYRSYIQNAKASTRRLREAFRSIGLDFDRVMTIYKANENASLPQITALAHKIYEDSTTIDNKTKASKSFKTVEDYWKNKDIPEAEQNLGIALSYVYAKLVHPEDPSKFYDTVIYETTPQAKIQDDIFRGVVEFTEAARDESTTPNLLVKQMQSEPKSTRGVRTFDATKEVDGIPVLFDKGAVGVQDISKNTIRNHYNRSLNRSVAKEVQVRKENPIYTSRFLDTTYNRLVKNIPAEDLNLETLQKKKQQLETIQDLKEKKILTTEVNNIEKALRYGELGSEEYILSQKRAEKVKRIQERFEAQKIEEDAIQAKTDLSEGDLEKSAELAKQKRTLNRKLKPFVREDIIRRKRKLEEQISINEAQLANETDFAKRQEIIEKIEGNKNELQKPFNIVNKNWEEDVKVYSLGGKDESARVRYSDMEDGTVHMDTMRLVYSQRNDLNLNAELYYRSEIGKAFIEDAAYLGKNTVVLPLGDNGVFHETMGQRYKTSDYRETKAINNEIKNLRSQRASKIAELEKATDADQIEILQTDVDTINKVIDDAIFRKEGINRQIADKVKGTRHPELENINSRFEEIITEYVKDIDENTKVERVGDDLVIHLTDEVKNLLGRTLEEKDPFQYNKKKIKFEAPTEDLPQYTAVEIPKAEKEAVVQSKQILERKAQTLDEKIEKNRSMSKRIKVENTNIKIEIEKLKSYLDIGVLEDPSPNVKIYKKGKQTVITADNYVITGRFFTQDGKKGFMFETMFDNETGQQAQRTINQSTERVQNYKLFTDSNKQFQDMMEAYLPYMKYFYKDQIEGIESNKGFLKITKEQYLDLREKLQVKSELTFVKDIYTIQDLLLGEYKKEKGKRKGRDTSTIDQDFVSAFKNQSRLVRDSLNEQGFDFKSFVKPKKAYREISSMQASLRRHKDTINQRFEEKYGKINAAVLRLNDVPLRQYAQALDEQFLDLNSLNTSSTADMFRQLLGQKVEVFAFDSPTDHMLQNFLDIMEQSGGGATTHIITTNNKVYPTLRVGLQKRIFENIFSNESSLFINSDIHSTLDLLGREKLSTLEAKKVETIQKIFGIDPNLSAKDQKAILKEQSDIYQTYQPQRTSKTYYGLQRRGIDRLIDGIDEQISLLGRKDADKRRSAILSEKRKELQNQKDKYANLEKEAIEFYHTGDSLHTDILEFAKDQTGGVKLRVLRNQLDLVEEYLSWETYVGIEEIQNSYVENMVLDTAQQGFDSIGFPVELADTNSVSTLKKIAKRFGAELEEVKVLDKSGEIPITLDFITFKFPKDLKNNVSNISGHRFIRSIETKDPVLVTPNSIEKLLQNDEVTIRTAYGDLNLKAQKIADLQDATVKQEIDTKLLDVFRSVNRIDINNQFDTTMFEMVDPKVQADYQQAIYAKGVADVIKESLKEYVQITIEGLDGIETIERQRLEQASRPNRGNVEVKDSDIDFWYSQKVVEDNPSVLVEYRPGKRLATDELIALEQGIGLNDTLVRMQEVYLEAEFYNQHRDYQVLTTVLGLESIGEVEAKYLGDAQRLEARTERINLIEKDILPEGFKESSFGQHPQADYSVLLPLLYIEYKNRFISRKPSRKVRFKDIEPAERVVRPQFEEGEDSIARITYDVDRLRVRLSDNMNIDDFIVVNSNILVDLMPENAYKNLTSKYDSANGLLTNGGVKQFATDMISYLKTDSTIDLKSRAIFDHITGQLQQIWDYSHRKAVPKQMADNWNTLFNPHGRAISEATDIIGKKSKHKIGLRQSDDILSGQLATGAVTAVAKTREILSVLSKKDLIDRINNSPNTKKLQRYSADEDGNPLFRIGSFKEGDKVDPKFLLTTIHGILEEQEYVKQGIRTNKEIGSFGEEVNIYNLELFVAKSFARGGNIIPRSVSKLLQESFFREKLIPVTPKFYAPESVASKLQQRARNSIDFLLGDFNQRKRLNENGHYVVDFDSPSQRDRFLSAINALGGEFSTSSGLPQSIIDFVLNPESRNYVSIVEIHAVIDAFINREAPSNFTTKKAFVEKPTGFYGGFEYIFEGFKSPERSPILRGPAKGVQGVIDWIYKTYFEVENLYKDLPINVREPFEIYVGRIRNSVKNVTRNMRQIADNGSEAERIKNILIRQGKTPEQADLQIKTLLSKMNKGIINIERIIAENSSKLEYVDAPKIGLFYDMFEKLINNKDETNIFNLYDIDTLQNLDNVLNSKQFGMTISEQNSIQILRDFQNKYKDFKRDRPEASFQLTDDDAYLYQESVQKVQEALLTREKSLSDVAGQIYKRFTSEKLEGSPLDKHYSSTAKRKLLTLFFDGKYINHPGMEMLHKNYVPENIFTNKNGVIVFKETDIPLTQDSAKAYLFDNGYGFLNEQSLPKFKADTISDLQDLMIDYMNMKDTQSIQTWLALDNQIYNNFAGIDPRYSGQDTMTILGGLAILTEEFMSKNKLAEDLSASTLQDIDAYIAEAKLNSPGLYILDLQNFRTRIVDYVTKLATASISRLPSDTDIKANFKIVEGELNKPLIDSQLDSEAFRIAVDITKDLDIYVTKSDQKHVAQYNIGNNTFVLPTDFIQGLERLREEMVQQVKINKVGQSEIIDNIVLLELERNKKTSFLTEEQKKELIGETVKKKKSVAKEAAITGIPFAVFAGLLGASYPVAGAVGGVFAAISSYNYFKEAIKNKLPPAFHTKDMSNRIIFQAMTETQMLLSPNDKAKFKQILDKYHAKNKQSDEITAKRLVRTYGIDASFAVGTIGLTYSLMSLMNPFYGFLSGIYLSGTILKPILEAIGTATNKNESQVRAQLVKDFQGIYADFSDKIVDELGSVEFDSETIDKFNAYSNEIRTIKKYLEKDPKEWLQNPVIRYTDEILARLSESMNVQKVSSNIKMAVTALSGPMYWSTNWFGLQNQSHLDNGFNKRNASAIIGFGLGVGMTGSASLGFLASQVAVPFTEMMSQSFSNVMNTRFGGKRNIYGGPSSISRNRQINLMMSEIQETSLSLRMGTAVGAYMGIGALEMGFASSLLGGVATGAAVGTGVAYLLKLGIDQIKKNPTQDNFTIMTKSGKIYTKTQVLEYMDAYGVLSTYVREETGAMVASEARNIYPRFFERYYDNMNKTLNRYAMEIAEGYDLYYRMGEYLEYLEQGLSPKAAAERVKNTYFDYSDLSEFEKKYMRQVFLFYSFMRKNLAFMARKLVENPERIFAWGRLTKNTQQMAFDDSESDFHAGNFWESRLVLPKHNGWINQFINADKTAVPYKFKSVQVLPQANIYDLMVIGGAANDLFNLVDLESKDSWQQYLLTNFGPQSQFFAMQFTGEVPFGSRPLESFPIRSRHISHARNLLGDWFIGTNEDALITFKAVSLAEQMKNRTLPTAERFEIKPKGHPIDDYRLYLPATKDDGLAYQAVTNIAMQSLYAGSLMGKGLQVILPTGRSARAFEAVDRLDLMTASFLDIAKQLGIFTEKEDYINAAVQDLALDGIQAPTDDQIMVKSKEIFKRRCLDRLREDGYSVTTQQFCDLFIEEYVKTDAIDRNSILGMMYGLPYIASPSTEGLEQQIMNDFKYNLQDRE